MVTATRGPSRGQQAPQLSNADASDLVGAFHGADNIDAFPLWYQYAAVAYGWSPPDSDMLDASTARGANAYDADIAVALWLDLKRVATELDNSGSADARLIFDGVYDDVVWLGEVRAALLQDGASATFKIPLPMCKDKRTGKRRIPRVPCDKNGQRRDPLTGALIACDMPGDCDPESVDDPITHAFNQLLPWALILGALWLIRKDSQPRRRRRN